MNRSLLSGLVFPPGTDATAIPLLAGRALRGFCDGFVAVLLPAYLLALGFDQLAVGLISSVTLIGSAMATILVGLIGNRFPQRRLLIWAAVLMAATGAAFAGLSSLWPLLIVAFVGTLNPSSGDVSVFLPLEQARLAEAAAPEARTALFARYGLAGSLSAAFGALAAAIPGWLGSHTSLSFLDAMRLMFLVYALTGVALWALYAKLPEPHAQSMSTATPLGPSRRIVIRLALLFSVDAFAGGLVVNALLSLWLMQRFGDVSGRGGPVLLLGRTIDHGFPARRRSAGPKNRAIEHHGVHAHPIQRVSDCRRLCTIVVADADVAAGAQCAVSNGCADADGIRDGGGHPRRADRGRESDCSSAQPRRRDKPSACRWAHGTGMDWSAAAGLWCIEDRL